MKIFTKGFFASLFVAIILGLIAIRAGAYFDSGSLMTSGLLMSGYIGREIEYLIDGKL